MTYTEQRQAEGKSFTGLTALDGFVGSGVVRRVREWLGIRVELQATPNGQTTIMSAAELRDTKYPEISYWWGDLLRTKGRLCLIGEPKTAKSFFAIELGLHMASGTPFLGMETKGAVVLYVNFEISQGKLQGRLDDLCSELAIPHPENLLLVSPGAIAVETEAGKQELEGYIQQAKAQRGRVDVVILDPRRQAMGGDENQSEILQKWCSNVDELKTTHNFAVVIVHHKGKSTTGAGRGSSVYDCWLDTMLWLEPFKVSGGGGSYEEGQPDLKHVRMPIKGRDTDHGELRLEFRYPTWHLTEKQEATESTKIDEAAKAITIIMQAESTLPLAELRRRVIMEGNSEYGFKQALGRLVSEGQIEEQKELGKQGNHKMVAWVSPPE